MTTDTIDSCATDLIDQPTVWLGIDDVRPSPENDLLYRPVDPADPEFVGLVASVRQRNILERLVVTSDGYTVSGHRRHAAAKVAGLSLVPAVVLPIRRGDDVDAFVALLREYNRNRFKTNDERLREELVSISKEDAYTHLKDHRRAESDMSDFSGSPAIQLGGRLSRAVITDAKVPMLNAAVRVINGLRDYWPISDRQVHYGMLNLKPLRHASKPDSHYQNNLQSYKDLCDLLTRARLDGTIPWHVIADETRPCVQLTCWADGAAFAAHQAARFLKGYWRNLQQSQPTHIEIVAEKLTVQTIVTRVALDYCLPTTIGRGYSSIQPRHALAERFKKSGRDRLVLLMLTDYDPDGEGIAESFVRSIRDDFGIPERRITAVKVALGKEQVERHRLPPTMAAKRTSSRFASFNRDHGDFAYELEALPPDVLSAELKRAIEGVIDHQAYEHELGREAEDAQFLAGLRRTVLADLASWGVAS